MTEARTLKNSKLLESIITEFENDQVEAWKASADIETRERAFAGYISISRFREFLNQKLEEAEKHDRDNAGAGTG